MYSSYYEKVGDVVTNIDEETPFDIPDGWCWCRLGILFQHNTGKALNSANQTGGLLPYITTSNVYWNRFELDCLKAMAFTEAEIEKCTVKKGDLLVCEGGDIGRAAIWNYDYPIRIQNHIHRLREYSNDVDNLFYYYVLYLYKQIGILSGNGIGIQGLSSNRLHNLLIPFPPKEEQSRIVESVECYLQELQKIEESLN